MPVTGGAGNQSEPVYFFDNTGTTLVSTNFGDALREIAAILGFDMPEIGGPSNQNEPIFAFDPTGTTMVSVQMAEAIRELWAAAIAGGGGGDTHGAKFFNGDTILGVKDQGQADFFNGNSIFGVVDP